MRSMRRVRWSDGESQRARPGLVVPLVWTLTNAVKRSADIYRAPWDIPWPPAIGNIGEAWTRGQLGQAMANSAYVTAMTVAAGPWALGLCSVRTYAVAAPRSSPALPGGPGAVDDPD
jgi:ABC-type glycerol-3-phosphate transport system permease component